MLPVPALITLTLNPALDLATNTERVAPTHVAGVRRWFIDQLTPDELETVAGVFTRIDEALGCPNAQD